MALTLYNIFRWYKMLSGRSIWHVNQNLGICFSKDSVQGYYNNMTEKVSKMPELLSNDLLPQLDLANGDKVYFPVAIFQYGLGAYDLFLLTNDFRYKTKFLQCVEWTMNYQDEEGRWNNFFYIYPDYPFGAMAQGEAVSLLVRAFIHTNDKKYLIAAKKGIDFMVTTVVDGGVTDYHDGDIVFLEFSNKSAVLNGWIFAWWGLYDYVLVSGDKDYYKDILDSSLRTLIKYLPKFNNSYWSVYSLDNKLASPFYHNLHIAQMQAMYMLTNEPIFNDYAIQWAKEQHSLLNKSLAFIIKAFQKLIE